MLDKHDIQQIEAEQIQPKPACEPLSARYRVSDKLGAGSYGAVYVAVQISTGKKVAIKVLKNVDNEHDATRFSQEAHALSLLAHPNIVSLIDYGHDEESRPYLVLDYVEGKTLDDFLKEKKTLSVGAFKDIFVQVCKGLAHAHSKGIVHRDLKPGNLMIVEETNGERVVKVVDFGIARDTSRETRATATGGFVGSPAYISPEQAQGFPVDARSDIYSLGCVMYECLTGRLPFAGENAIQTIMQRLHGEAPPFKADGLEEIVLRCLRKDPSERYADIDALQADLAMIGDEDKFKDWSQRQRRARIIKLPLKICAVALPVVALLMLVGAVLLLNIRTAAPVLSVVSIGDRERQAKIELELAAAAKKLGNPQLAQDYARSAIPLFEAESMAQSDPDLMMKLENQALQASATYKVKLLPETLSNLDRIAASYLHGGFRKNAKYVYKLFGVYYPYTGESVGDLINVCANKCTEARNKKNFLEAEQWALKRFYLTESFAWFLDPKNKGKEARAEAASTAGWVYKDQGLTTEAIAMWKTACEDDQGLSPIARGATWIEIGRSELERNQVEEAQEAFANALAIFNSAHNEFWQGIAFSQLAHLETEQQNRKGAAKLAQQGLALMLAHPGQVTMQHGKDWYGSHYAPIAFVDCYKGLSNNWQAREATEAFEQGLDFLEKKGATNTYLHNYIGMEDLRKVAPEDKDEPLRERVRALQARIEKTRAKESRGMP